MKTLFRLMLSSGAAATLGAAIALTAPSAVAQPQECLEQSTGVHECTSPGHAQIHVPPPAPPNNPNIGPGGGPPHLPWIG